MDPTQVVLDKGAPIAMATVVYAAIKALRSNAIQGVLAMISPKLVWRHWPKPLCMGVVFAGGAAAAVGAALLGGTPLVAVAPIGIAAGLGAMGIDAGIGSVQEPTSTSKKDVASIIVPIPDAK